MEPYVIWALVGLALVIVEVLTGTFYLLVLGVACFGAAAVALARFGFPAQVVTAAVVATAMTVLDKTKQAQASAQGA